MNNGQGFGYNYQPAKKFTFPPIAKDTASIIGYIGALLMIIGSFLDFVTLKVTSSGTVIYDESVNYFITDGSIKDGALILFFALGALALIHFRKNLIAIAPTAIAGIILLLDFVDSNEKINEIKELYDGFAGWLDYKVDASFGLAPFVILIGIIAVVVHVVLYVMNKNKANQPQMMNGMPNQNMNYGQPMVNNQQPMQQPNYNQPYPNQQMPGPMPMQQPMPGQQPMYNQPANGMYQQPMQQKKFNPITIIIPVVIIALIVVLLLVTGNNNYKKPIELYCEGLNNLDINTTVTILKEK